MRFSHIVPIALVIANLIALPLEPVAADDGSRQYQFARGLYARAQWETASEELESFLKSHPNHPDSAQAAFYLGEALVQQRRYGDAAGRFEGYLEALPDGPLRKRAQFRLAECDFLGNLPTAGQRLDAFSAAYPDDRLNGLILNYRGQLALRQKKPRQAEILFRQSLDRALGAISQDQCRLGLARALELLDSADEAERYYLALAAKPQSPSATEAKYRLGSLRYAQQQYQSALATFAELDSLADSDPWAASAGLGKGWALMKLDRHGDAATQFARLVDHPAAAVQARYWLGLCRKAEKDWQGATKAFLAAAEKLEEEQKNQAARGSAGDVTRTSILFHAGDSQLAAGNLADARSQFDRAIAVAQPDEVWLGDAHRAAVQTSLRLKDHTRARADAERFLADHTESRISADLLRLLVRTQLEQEDFAAAEETLRRLDDDAQLGTAGSAEDAYLLALSHQGQRQFDKALNVLQPVLTEAEGELAKDARLVEASLLVALKRHDDALKVLTTYLSKLEPGSDRHQALALMAVCHAQLGHGDEAQRLYEEAFGADGEFATLRWDAAEQIAEAAFKAKQWDRAETLYRELIESDVESQRQHRATVGLAWVQHERSDDVAAEATLANLLETGPDSDVSAEALYLRGCVLRELGQFEAACRSFVQVADSHAGSNYGRDALWDAAQLHEQLGRPQQAATSYQRILDLGGSHSRHAAALYNLAWIRRKGGELEEAAILFRRIVAEAEDSPFRSHAILSVAQHEFDAGNGAEAKAILAELLNQGHDDPVRDRALYLAGQIAFDAAEWGQARQRFEQLVRECPQSELLHKAAFAAAETAFHGNEPDALTSFEQLLSDSHEMTDPLRAPARMRLAQLYAESGRWDEAAAVAESFADDHPGFDQQYELDYVRGRCLAARALFAEARQAYEQVIRSPSGERSETAAKAQLMIAETFFHQRDYAEAFRAYMQVEILYDYPELQSAALLQAAKCRQLQGKSDAATALYQQVLESYPGTHAAEQAALRLQRET